MSLLVPICLRICIYMEIVQRRVDTIDTFMRVKHFTSIYAYLQYAPPHNLGTFHQCICQTQAIMQIPFHQYLLSLQLGHLRIHIIQLRPSNPKASSRSRHPAAHRPAPQGTGEWPKIWPAGPSLARWLTFPLVPRYGCTRSLKQNGMAVSIYRETERHRPITHLPPIICHHMLHLFPKLAKNPRQISGLFAFHASRII